MVGRYVVFVLEAHAGIDRDEHVVAIAGRVHPQPVGVQVGAVEAMRGIGALGRLDAAGVGRKPVVEPHADGVPGPHFQHGRHEGGARADMRALVAAQPHLVIAPGCRVPEGAVGIDDIQVQRHLVRWRQGGVIQDVGELLEPQGPGAPSGLPCSPLLHQDGLRDPAPVRAAAGCGLPGRRPPGRGPAWGLCRPRWRRWRWRAAMPPRCREARVPWFSSLGNVDAARGPSGSPCRAASSMDGPSPCGQPSGQRCRGTRPIR